MSWQSWDTIIVGQGLAGTTLAWRLHEAGQRVLLLDACEPVTSSKIAAGLITPITGQRLVLTWKCDEFFPAAREFYASIERRTGRKFFYDRTAVRLFQSQAERLRWSHCSERPDFRAHLVEPHPLPLLDPALGDDSGGGFVMRTAQLDVPAYLEASRSVLPWAPATIDWQRDVTFRPDGITAGGHAARRLISCEGFAAVRNPYFASVPFKGARGDVLSVRFHKPVPQRCLHRGIWIAPTPDPAHFSVGSTYDWSRLTCEPSAAGRDTIERQLEAFFHVPYTVEDHRAAVRPIIQASKALMGLHRRHEQLGYFNGLASKGSLHAPLFAGMFADFLLHGSPLPVDLNVRKYV